MYAADNIVIAIDKKKQTSKSKKLKKLKIYAYWKPKKLKIYA
jgi:hypothetical protein